MQKGDVRLTPLVNFTGTKAAIEAIADPVEGMIAQATDSPYEIGRYANGAWVWGGGGGGTPGGADTSVQYNNSGTFGGAKISYTEPSALSLLLKTNDQPTLDTAGIDLTIEASAGNGAANGGSLYLRGGSDGDGNHVGGHIYIEPGNGDVTGKTYLVKGVMSSLPGAPFHLSGGESPTSDGGSATLHGGDSLGGAGQGGDVYVAPGTKDTGGARDGYFGIRDAVSSIYAILKTTGLTAADKIFTFPDKNGTFALLDDVGVLSVTGDGVDNTDPANPVLTYPTPADIGAQVTGTYLTPANITQVITNGVTDKAPSEDAVFDALALKVPMTVLTDTQEPTGWLDPDAVAAAMTYDSTTQKISISGTHSYYWRGIKTSVTDFVSTAHDNTVGHQYYLSSGDGSTFTWATDTVWTFDVIMVAFVNYQTAVKFALAESHGLMQWQVHETLHQTIGTYKESGGTLDPATYTLLSTTAAQRRPNVIAAHLHDEDVDSVLAALTSATYNKFYLSSTGTNNFTGLTADIVPLLTNNPYYNLFSTPNWTQVLMANNSYMCVWLAAMPVTQDAASQAYRYIWIQGQANGNLASQEALQPASLNLGTLSTESSEIVFLVKIIIRYTGGNWDLYSITNLTGSKFSQVGASAGNYLSAVTTNGSLTGDGTTGNPLSASSGATTATAVGTTTLTVSSYTIQEFTGATTQTVVLPVVTTLRLGHQFRFINNSSGLVTVNSSGGNLVTTVAAGATVFVSCILITGTTAASWSVFNAAATYSTLASMSAANAALLVGGASTLLHGHNLADGQMMNGKIVPSVSSNNLTLALKGMDGNDPSATNPVLVRIGNTIRSITAALSVTKNAGTNWFGSGATILATKEIDYFAYLGYNTTDGVVLGFSRVPYASLYSDFSATTTSETYAAISTTTNAAAGDNYVNIGRFAATLSATASFNWSVPTFTAANLKQCPTYETRLLTWAPVITSDTGTPTTVTNTCKYKLMGSDIEYLVSVTVVDKGTANGNINLTYPFLVAITQSGAGRENAATGASVGAKITSTVIGLSKYDTTTLWVNTYNPSVLIRAVL
jgi:hypothetical protein